MKRQSYPRYPILIIDDEPAILASIEFTLAAHGMNNSILCSDSREVRDIVHKNILDCILLDLTMPYIRGEELLDEIHSEHPDIPIIVVTGNKEIATAVECMKAGAFDYMVKPVEESRLTSGVKRALEMRQLRRDYARLKEGMFRERLEHPDAFSGIITADKTMLGLFRFIEAIADSTETILITGETGTGKELFARAVHKASCRKGEFVAVNVAGLDDTLFSDTLFGHSRGAYTGALESRNGFVVQAKHGTLFLDEIGDLSQASQVKLLRFLESGEYYAVGSDLVKHSDARILIATNRNLRELVEKGLFRKDLYYRIYTHEVWIPPLRERKGDIPLLAEYFLQEAVDAFSCRKPVIPSDIYKLFDAYPFPGNVRELRSLIFGAVGRRRSAVLSLKDIKDALGIKKRISCEHFNNATIEFGEVLPSPRQAVDLLIAEALRRAQGNQSAAATLLGISHQALNKRLKRKKLWS